jgi:putrescine transport system ATP-binding protein
VTFVVVTHDQEEAMTLSSRLAVMDKGRIMQIGTSTDVYEFPKNRFVAGFIGSINQFDGVVEAIDGDIARVQVPALGGTVLGADVPRLTVGHEVAVAVRPEKIAISRDRPETGNAVHGRVESLAYFGKDSLYRVRLPSGVVVLVNSVNARRAGEHARVADWEDDVWLSFQPSSAILLLE